MKLVVIVCLLFVTQSLWCRNDYNSNFTPPPEYDVSNDTMFFDLSKALISGNGPYFYDVPVYIRSNGPISNFDFWFKYNQSDLTYVSTINLVSALDPYTNYNSDNQFLSNTTSGPTLSYTVPMNTSLLYVRFQLDGSCTLVDSSDFTSVSSLMNGSVCKHKFINLGSGSSFMGISPSVLCEGDTAFFKGPDKVIGKTVSEWGWDFGNGATASTKDVSSVYGKGKFSVSLVTTTADGCVYINYRDLAVGAIPKVSFSYAVTSDKDSVLFTNLSDSASYLWDLGDNMKSTSKNPIHTYSGGGSFNVTLTAENQGCSNKFTDTILVDRPTALFTYSGKCSGSAVNFTNKSSYAFGTISSYQWDFGDGNTSNLINPENYFGVPGDYDVSLRVTSSNGLTALYKEKIAIDNKPVVLFSVDSLKGCSPFEFNFTNKSLAQASSSSYWDFGDDSFSLEQNPKKTFTKPGEYAIKLTVSSPNGCVDSLSKSKYVTVLESPVADFKNTEACANSTIQFSEIPQSGSPSSAWNWNFGSGTSSTAKQVNHLFPAEGNYDVTLKVKNPLGCSNSITRTVFVRNRPKAQFSTSDTQGCVPLTAGFNNNSTFSSGSTFTWFFGDGNQSSVQQPKNVFATSGKFSVKLVAVAPGGCADSLSKSDMIEVLSGVQANFKADQNCSGVLTKFSDLSVTSSGKVSKWGWDFGNGFTSDVQNPQILFNNPGTYQVKLSATTSDGCADTVNLNVNMDPKPQADFTVESANGCAPHLAVFSNTTTQDSGASYLWKFGDGDTSVLKNPSHTYNSTASYNVSLFVQSLNGCSDTTTKIQFIKLQSPPTAAFNVLQDTLFVPESIAFVDNQSVGAATYAWSFGDGFYSELFEPSHLYIDTGQFTICLSSISQYACKATSCDTIVVLRPSVVAVPTAFTPNGDGVNDEFLVRGGPFSTFEMQVFNQWGNLIFRSTDPTVGWDGTYSGQPQPSGSYEYIITAKSPGKEELNEYGVINIKSY
jgi:gliding motility-associated-like protein